MGCASSSETPQPLPPDGPVRKVDPRLPFDTYRQVFTLKNYWKAVNRSLEDTAKDNLFRFFTKHPQHQQLHRDLKHLKSETEMKDDLAFENAAVAIFNVVGEVMESIDQTDTAIGVLLRAGKFHAGIEGFKQDYFKDMEESFMGSINETLGDRFTEAAESLFKKLYTFMLKYLEEGFNS